MSSAIEVHVAGLRAARVSSDDAHSLALWLMLDQGALDEYNIDRPDIAKQFGYEHCSIEEGDRLEIAAACLLLVAEFQLLRLPLDGSEEEPLEWLDIGPLGKHTSPPVLHGSSLYFGTSKRGLVRAGEPALE